MDSVLEQFLALQIDGCIRFTFRNAHQFTGTYPIFCCIGGKVFGGCENWVRLFVAIVEHELSMHNPRLESLYHESLSGRGKTFFLKDKLPVLYCKRLSNGYYVNVNVDTPTMINTIAKFCIHCGYTQEQIIMYGIPKSLCTPAPTPSTSTPPTPSPASTPPQESPALFPDIDTPALESYLLSLGLHGSTPKDISAVIHPSAPAYAIANALDDSKNILHMPADIFIHANAFVDLQDAAQTLDSIIRSHFAIFSGYTNSQLVYGAASQELSMFLNDNACDNSESLYAVTRYLFEKHPESRKPLTFSAPHIFENPPDFPPTTKGLMIRLARLNNGILTESQAKTFLQKTMLTFTSINHLLQIGSSNTFLLYEPDTYILTETLNVNANFCTALHDMLDDLFRTADVAYVIPHDIRDSWLATLPALPEGLTWNRLLLQEILAKFPAVGFIPITSGLNQTHSTIAAAFVPRDSQLQTFADIVSLYMEEHHTLPERMHSETLRTELKKSGMIANNELLYSLHNALHDPRFVWSNHNRSVFVRGNR